MYKKIRRLLLVPVTAFFCTIALSSTLPDAVRDVGLQAGDPSWLYAANDSVMQSIYYCQVGNNAKYKTRKGDEREVLMKIEKDPDKYILGKCEDVISPS